MGQSDATRARNYRDRRRGGPPRELEPHGTVAAFKRHKRAKETPCDPCRLAEKRRQNRLYEARKSRQKEQAP